VVVAAEEAAVVDTVAAEAVVENKVHPSLLETSHGLPPRKN
jgi:hypothetical protein